MRPRLFSRCRAVSSKLVGFAVALVAACLATASPLAAAESSPRSWTAKVALTAAGQGAPALALCSARLDEGSSALALLCRHELGTDGLISLVRAGSGARSEAPFWSAPLASPFEAVVPLDDPALAALLAGELALRIESAGAAGVVAEGTIDTPIFDDGFDTFSMCNWSNFPCASDGNVCTTETCSSTGVCTHPPNTNSCPLPNATGGCFLGGCVIQSCNFGFSNCDITNTNGCETVHNTNTGSCASPTNLGEAPGDLEYIGPFFVCTGTFSDNFASRTGIGEAWFKARATECSNCSANVRHIITLEVPDGVDFDLFVYRGCSLVDSSTGAAGVDEQVEVLETESSGSDDSFDYQIEVKYFSGGSCEEWTLNLFGALCG